jgi:hypothetical protein
MSKSFETELARVKSELHGLIRARAAAMTSKQRAEYARALPKSFRHIVHERVTSATRLSAHAAELDRVFGLAEPTRAVTRTASQLVADASGITTSVPPTPRAASSTRPANGRCPRETSTGRVTALSPDAAMMDQLMGIEPARATPRVQRSRDAFVFSAL